MGKCRILIIATDSRSVLLRFYRTGADLQTKLPLLA